MIWQGFHVDERQRLVFDAAMPHVPGGGKGAFNHRFAQTTRHPSEFEDHQALADFFPFVPGPQTDPVTGAAGDVLAVAKSLGKVPLVMYTGTSTRVLGALGVAPAHRRDRDERRGSGSARARVLHRRRSAPEHAHVGAQRVYEHPGNPLDHSAPLRALLVALDQWATNGTRAARERVPAPRPWRTGDRRPAQGRFPAIPGARHPGVAAAAAAPRLRSAVLDRRASPTRSRRRSARPT